MNIKKILLIIVLLIITAIIGFFIYGLFFSAPVIQTPESEEKPSTTTTKLPGAKTGAGIIVDEEGGSLVTGETEDEQRIREEAELRRLLEDIDDKALGGITKTKQLTDAKSLSPSLSSDGKNLQYYNKDDGKFYVIDADGNAKTLSNKVFHSVANVVWSPKKNKAVIEYPDGANIVYDFASNKQVTLPKHWENFEFSNDGSQLVMKSIGLDPDNRWLAISNDDGSQSRAIEHIGKNADKVYPSWSPNNQSVALYAKGVDLNRQEIFFLGLNDENFKSTIVEGRGFQHQWSEEGDRLAYSVYSSDNDMKPKLWIVNAEGEAIGQVRKNLGVETWAKKCTFANNQDLYCGVPESLERGAGLFPEIAEYTKDDLYKINVQTGQKRLIAIPDGHYNMNNLIVTEDESTLYFTDSISGLLHKIELK